jgi:hypothetical protein
MAENGYHLVVGYYDPADTLDGDGGPLHLDAYPITSSVNAIIEDLGGCGLHIVSKRIMSSEHAARVVASFNNR